MQWLASRQNGPIQLFCLDGPSGQECFKTPSQTFEAVFLNLIEVLQPHDPDVQFMPSIKLRKLRFVFINSLLAVQ